MPSSRSADVPIIVQAIEEWLTTCLPCYRGMTHADRPDDYLYVIKPREIHHLAERLGQLFETIVDGSRQLRDRDK